MSSFKDAFTNKQTVANLDSNSFEKMIGIKDSVLIDVRTIEENVKISIPNSILIDIHQPDFLARIDELDKTKTYLVYCHSGNRSYTACLYMQSMGFQNVFNLAHGISKYSGALKKN
jgi:rhodanese-related sulfurtransferase